MMHPDDQGELLATAANIEQQARQMLAADRSASERARLQRIVLLVQYMKEHLEMLREPGEPAEATS
jgi:hypothetical protein